jgi:hypothetical protein
MGRTMSRREKLMTFGPTPGVNGVIELGEWEECFTPYRGPRRMEDVWVVGRGSEHEQLFDSHSGKAAREWASTHSLKIFRASSTELCSEAVERLFGES